MAGMAEAAAIGHDEVELVHQESNPRFEESHGMVKIAINVPGAKSTEINVFDSHAETMWFASAQMTPAGAYPEAQADGSKAVPCKHVTRLVPPTPALTGFANHQGPVYRVLEEGQVEEMKKVYNDDGTFQEVRFDPPKYTSTGFIKQGVLQAINYLEGLDQHFGKKEGQEGLKSYDVMYKADRAGVLYGPLLTAAGLGPKAAQDADIVEQAYQAEKKCIHIMNKKGVAQRVGTNFTTSSKLAINMKNWNEAWARGDFGDSEMREDGPGNVLSREQFWQKHKDSPEGWKAKWEAAGGGPAKDLATHNLKCAAGPWQHIFDFERDDKQVGTETLTGYRMKGGEVSNQFATNKPGGSMEELNAYFWETLGVEFNKDHPQTVSKVKPGGACSSAGVEEETPWANLCDVDQKKKDAGDPCPVPDDQKATYRALSKKETFAQIRWTPDEAWTADPDKFARQLSEGEGLSDQKIQELKDAVKGEEAKLDTSNVKDDFSGQSLPQILYDVLTNHKPKTLMLVRAALADEDLVREKIDEKSNRERKKAIDKMTRDAAAEGWFARIEDLPAKAWPVAEQNKDGTVVSTNVGPFPADWPGYYMEQEKSFPEGQKRYKKQDGVAGKGVQMTKGEWLAGVPEAELKVREAEWSRAPIVTEPVEWDPETHEDPEDHDYYAREFAKQYTYVIARGSKKGTSGPSGDKWAGMAVLYAAMHGYEWGKQLDSEELMEKFPDRNAAARRAYQMGMAAQVPQAWTSDYATKSPEYRLDESVKDAEVWRTQSEFKAEGKEGAWAGSRVDDTPNEREFKGRMLRTAFFQGFNSSSKKPDEMVPPAEKLREAFKTGKRAVCIGIHKDDWSRGDVAQDVFIKMAMPVDFNFNGRHNEDDMQAKASYNWFLKEAWARGAKDAWSSRKLNVLTHWHAADRVPDSTKEDKTWMSCVDAFKKGAQAAKYFAEFAKPTPVKVDDALLITQRVVTTKGAGMIVDIDSKKGEAKIQWTGGGEEWKTEQWLRTVDAKSGGAEANIARALGEEDGRDGKVKVMQDSLKAYTDSIDAGFANNGLSIANDAGEVDPAMTVDAIMIITKELAFKDGLDQMFGSYPRGDSKGQEAAKADKKYPYTNEDLKKAFDDGVACRARDDKKKAKKGEEEAEEEDTCCDTFIGHCCFPCIMFANACFPICSEDPATGKTLCCGGFYGDWLMILLCFALWYTFLGLWYWTLIEIMFCVAEPARAW